MVAWHCEVKIAFSRTFLMEITNSFCAKDIYVPELLPCRLVPVEFLGECMCHMVAWHFLVKMALERKSILEITKSLFVGEIDVPELLSYRLVPVEQ